jgi:putative Holliday junction resolvase
MASGRSLFFGAGLKGVDMPNILALDVGQRRVGVAVTDPAGLTAQPLTVLDRKPHGLFLESLTALVQQRGAELVLLGLPRRTTGALGPEAQRVMALAHELRSKLGLKVETFDERLTTAVAERAMAEAGLGRRQARPQVDKTAAAVILEGYLDSLAAQKTTDRNAAVESAS